MEIINYKDEQIAARIWLSTAMVFAGGCATIFLFDGNIGVAFGFATLGLIVAAVASLPALLILYIVVYPIMRCSKSLQFKYRLLILACLLITMGYALLPAYDSLYSYEGKDNWESFFRTVSITTGVLFVSALCAIAINHKAISSYFSQYVEEPFADFLSAQPNTTNMEQQEERLLYEPTSIAGKCTEEK